MISKKLYYLKFKKKVCGTFETEILNNKNQISASTLEACKKVKF